jgi:alcohol dehydrogenase class IV
MAASAFEALPSMVVFGKGTLARAAEVFGSLGAARALVICTRSQSEVAEAIADRLVGAKVFSGAAMHTPVEVTDQAMAIVEEDSIDGLIAVGGGSAIGLGKAIALRTDLPQLAIPTTYAGSEMTPIVGQTEGGRKTTQRSLKVLPEAVIYDVELTLALPSRVSVTSGFNAIAHAVEALWAQAPNPLLDAVAEDCVRRMTGALPRIVADLGDEAARTDALAGAWLGGWSLANGGSALHHRLCHILGGAFGLPHAETHTILLPHVVAYNAAAAPDAIARLKRALGAEDPGQALFELAARLGAPSALRDVGMPEDGADRALETLMASPPWNPRLLEPGPLRAMLLRAFAGERP